MENITAGGIQIAYERVGEGYPLILLHGAAEDSRIWQPQLAGLADDFTVVAWDEPGAGQSSDLPGEVELAEIADRLALLIENLELGPAHVAGMSWGGTVALELYRRHPRRVATLILIDTYAGWKGSLPADEVRARVRDVRQMLASPPENFDPMLAGLFADEPPTKFVPLLDAIAADSRPATFARQLRIMAETDLSDLLPQISIPTLLIWGQFDERSPLSVARQFEESIPDATLVMIEGAGHMSSLERPEAVNDAVRDFCRVHPPRRLP